MGWSYLSTAAFRPSEITRKISGHFIKDLNKGSSMELINTPGDNRRVTASAPITWARLSPGKSKLIIQLYT